MYIYIYSYSARNYFSFLRPVLITLIAIMTFWSHFVSELNDLVNKIYEIKFCSWHCFALLSNYDLSFVCVCFIPANFDLFDHSTLFVFSLALVIFHSRTSLILLIRMYSLDCINVRLIKMKQNFFVNMVYQMCYFNSFTVSESTDYLRFN